MQIRQLAITEVLSHFHWRMLGRSHLMAATAHLIESESRLFEVVSTTSFIVSRFHWIVDHVALAW